MIKEYKNNNFQKNRTVFMVFSISDERVFSKINEGKQAHNL
jgi:hypothetical protein